MIKSAFASSLVRCVMIVALLGAAPATAQTDQSAPAAEKPDATPPSIPTLRNLFGETVQDFRRLPSRETLTWLTIGAAVAAAGHPADATVTRSLSASRPLREAFGAGAMIGSAPLELGAAFTTYAIGRAANSPRVASVGADLFRAQIMAQATTYAIKYSVRRVRPDDSRFSFPSGHAAVTFASATVLQRHFGWKAGIPAFGVASYVAASRLQTKRHYLSDVAFGAALGIVAGRTVTIGRGARRFAVGPMATAGGGGVSFSWIGNR